MSAPHRHAPAHPRRSGPFLKAIQSPIRRYEFGFPYLDTSVLVETDADEVVIRITRDTFSPERKAAFVRELIAEVRMTTMTAVPIEAATC